MKKSLALIIIIAIIASLAFVTMGGIAFAEEQEVGEVEQGFDLRENYLAEISFGNFNMANGSIIRSFTITFDKDFFNELPDEGLQNKQGLLDYMNAFSLAIGYNPETDSLGRVVGSKKYDSTTDMYIEFGIDGYENEASDYQREDGLFYSKITSTQKTIFEGIESPEGSLNMLLNIMYIYGLSNEDISLSYHYGTPYKIISTDAEKSYFDTNGRIYVHEFYMNVATSGREIMLIQTIPNVVNWYIIAIALTVPVILVSIVWGLLWKRKQRKRGLI